MKANNEQQQHPLSTGRAVNISRNGNHQYWIGDGPRMSSVTAMLRHIEGDTFGIGLNWGLKIARENNGDLNAPRQATKASIEIGNQLHEAIDEFITHGTVREEDPVFLAWYHAVGTQNFIASERFLYHPEMAYGGTCDAISMNEHGAISIADWKTISPDHLQKYGTALKINKDSAQLAAYAYALRAMDSIWAPTEGYITYVARDGSDAIQVQVDLERGMSLFKASHALYLLTKNGT